MLAEVHIRYFLPPAQDELFQMSNWTGRPKVRKHGGMAQSVEHIVHIDGVVGSSPTVTTTPKPL